MALEPGHILNQRYRIVMLLGKGGMSSVYLAEDPRFERQVAIKILPRELMHEPDFRARFEREAKTIAALQHPAIVPVYDYGEEDGQPYLVMSFMPGGSLEDRLKIGPLSLADAANLFLRLAPALDMAHTSGIVHRDLKPGNILFDKYGNPYIADFGIVKLTEATTALTGTSSIVGTPAYMSPEQGRGEADIDGRSDIYSLGAILFQLLSGRLPYQATTPTGMIIRHINDPIPYILEIRPDLPSPCQTVIARAMAKRREERYPTMSEMAGALAAIAAGKGLPVIVASSVTDVVPPNVQPTNNVPSSPVASRPVAAGVSLPMQAVPSGSTYPPPERRFPWVWIAGGGAALMLLLTVVAVVTIGWLITRNAGHQATPTGKALAEATKTAQPKTVTHTPSPLPLTWTSSPQPPTFTATPVLATPTPAPSSTPTQPVIKAGDTQVAPLDGMVIVYVPEGEFTMGITSDQLAYLMSICPACEPRLFESSQPSHTIWLSGYWIYQTEVTNKMYAACEAAGVCQPPRKSSSQTRSSYYRNPTYDNYPVVYVDWNASYQYCQWAGGRLPTEAEWEKAARGTDGRLFPWGNEHPHAGLANTGNNIGDTTAVGAYRQGASPYGVLDMAGNVWEWAADWFEADYYRISSNVDPQGPASSSQGLRSGRGGSWYWGDSYASSAYHDNWAPEKVDSAVGFRCVVSP